MKTSQSSLYTYKNGIVNRQIKSYFIRMVILEPRTKGHVIQLMRNPKIAVVNYILVRGFTGILTQVPERVIKRVPGYSGYPFTVLCIRLFRCIATVIVYLMDLMLV